jgi:hypothetical protein
VLFGSAEVNPQDLESVCQTGIEFLKYEALLHPALHLILRS